tara:strand:+ start:183 stop:746 length:564 start_codon:yes stop_codon:yes gene_type:complete
MFLSINKLIIYSFISIGLFSVSTLSANEIPQNIQFKENTLVLNGQGTRIIFFMKVYEGSLYLENASTDANAIVNNNSPMAIRIDVTSEMVTAEAMKKALSEGLEKSTSNNTVHISNEIEQLSTSFNSVVESGDYYEFIYIPEIGTHVLKNNELVELIPGFDFKKAFFGIFLSNNPIQKNLKKAMLGG